MGDNVTKYGNLPVKAVADIILDLFQQVNPNFPEELAYEVKYGGLKSTIVYNNKKIIDVLSEISDDNEISISEACLAFLWCLSYAVITYYREGTAKAETFSESAERATKLLDYGLSLFREWNSWDPGFPSPDKLDATDTIIDEANAVMIYASIFVLCHEYTHHYLGYSPEGDTSTYEERKEDEFTADKIAVDTILKGIKHDLKSHEHTVKLGIIVGIGSVLFIDPILDGGPVHPDIDQRSIGL
ncbi:hypothetical protein [Spirosoma sp. KNUC1025]|uniref:hypothetical protein n=1 Tax=Spirosoma sp. KNUC1025 TaxID=2894082 RepID=UPI003870BBA7|nr:hypothetical protein LN737_15210 [Spirosoma sp. KNUC1025]